MTNETNASGIDAITAAEVKSRLEWEARTTAFTVNEIHMNAAGNPYYETVPVTVADARAVFDAALTEAGIAPGEWKSAFRLSAVPLSSLILTARAIEFFHGAPPVVARNADETFTMITAGYAA